MLPSAVSLSHSADESGAQSGQDAERGEPSPSWIPTADPGPSLSPSQNLKGPWARPAEGNAGSFPAPGMAPLGLSSPALGSMSGTQP